MTLKRLGTFLITLALYGVFTWAMWQAFPRFLGWVAIIMYLIAMVPTKDDSCIFYVQVILELMLALGGIIAVFIIHGPILGILMIILYFVTVLRDIFF